MYSVLREEVDDLRWEGWRVERMHMVDVDGRDAMMQWMGIARWRRSWQ